MELWQNVTPNAGNWLAINPQQSDTNRDAIGAWVEIRLPDGTTDIQERTIGGGHAGGKIAPLHFGLGPAEQIEFRVLWPDGLQSNWQGATANQILTVTQR